MSDSEADIEDRKEVERILRLEPEDRSTRDINFLFRFFESNLYFRKQAEMYEEKTILFLLKKMRFVEYEAGQTIFEYGDFGELFYVIIDGSVVVKTPSQVTLEGDQATAAGFVIYLLENFQDIHWKDLKDNVAFIRSLIIKELRYFHFDVSDTGQFDTAKVTKAVRQAMNKGRTTIQDYIYKIVNPKNQPAIRINQFKEVARLSEGQSFGELALL